MRDNFKPAGEVRWASFAANPPSFISTNPPSLTKTQKSGLRYEKRAQEYLQRLVETSSVDHNYSCLSNPWLMYSPVNDNPNAVFFCQPDFICFDNVRNKAIIVEIKLSHTGDSWKQIRQLYEPVLRVIYPGASIAAVEVCKWFDPHTPFPETYYYCENVLGAETDRFGIHIYKPRGKAK